MQFTTIVLGLSAMSLGSAFLIPRGLDDGIWAVERNEQGKEELRLISRSLPEARANGTYFPRRTPLPAGDSGCTGNGVNYGDLSIAQVQLETFCGASADLPQSIMLFTYGAATAYVCRYGDTNTCAAQEARAAFGSLSGDCGSPSSPLGGWYFLKDWNKTYGYDVAGASICANI